MRYLIIPLVLICTCSFGQTTSRVIKNPLLNSVTVLPDNSGVSYKIGDTLKRFNHPFDSISYKRSINRLEIFYTQTAVTVIDTIGTIKNKAVWLVPEKRKYSICNGDSATLSAEPYDTIIYNDKLNQIYIKKTVLQ